MTTPSTTFPQSNLTDTGFNKDNLVSNQNILKTTQVTMPGSSPNENKVLNKNELNKECEKTTTCKSTTTTECTPPEKNVSWPENVDENALVQVTGYEVTNRMDRLKRNLKVVNDIQGILDRMKRETNNKYKMTNYLRQKVHRNVPEEKTTISLAGNLPKDINKDEIQHLDNYFFEKRPSFNQNPVEINYIKKFSALDEPEESQIEPSLQLSKRFLFKNQKQKVKKSKKRKIWKKLFERSEEPFLN